MPRFGAKQMKMHTSPLPDLTHASQRRHLVRERERENYSVTFGRRNETRPREHCTWGLVKDSERKREREMIVYSEWMDGIQKLQATARVCRKKGGGTLGNS